MRMILCDWQDPANYSRCAAFSGAQWAWEFLRRNRVYQREWQAFHALWQALENDYGRPPDRDFGAWRCDPRAWVASVDCPAGDCRIDQDKVLIECALGARWGFHKFPPDPRDADAVAAGRLSWRERQRELPLLSADDDSYLGADPSRVALGFDLALPLREQLELAKRKLQILQRNRVRGGQLKLWTPALASATWIRYLRLLDAEVAGVAGTAMVILSQMPEMDLAAAREMVDGGYLELAWLATTAGRSES